MTATLRPGDVNHSAIGTRDIKAQIEFFTDVLGCPLEVYQQILATADPGV